jgi:hypothetical protein
MPSFNKEMCLTIYIKPMSGNYILSNAQLTGYQSWYGFFIVELTHLYKP